MPSPRSQIRLCSTLGQKYIPSEYLKAPYLMRTRILLMTFTGHPVLLRLMDTCTATHYFTSEGITPQREDTFRSVSCISDSSIDITNVEAAFRRDTIPPSILIFIYEGSSWPCASVFLQRCSFPRDSLPQHRKLV